MKKMPKKAKAQKIIESIPMAKMGKDGARLKMTKSAELDLNQKMKVQDNMYR